MVYQWIGFLQKYRPLGRCLACNAGLKESPYLCSACRSQLKRVERPCSRCGENLPPATPESQLCGRCQQHPPAFDFCHAPLVYEDSIRRLHHNFKFHRDLTAGKALGILLAAELAHRARPLPELLLPVPLHPRRMRQRGFDQAHELARDLSRNLHIPYLPKLLHRCQNTAPQSGLRRTERQRNLQQAFRLRGAVPAQHIALIDDVMTTGATFEAVAKLCKAAGVETVEVWAVSRTLAD